MKAVKQEVSFPHLEEEVLKFWKENQTFQRSLDKHLSQTIDGKKSDTPRKSYVFYDGPPFATGLPHYGHLLAGTIKDVVGRYFTMKGFHVDRRFGWDCHGLPVEFEIQKALDLHGAKAIRAFGVANFNEECRKIVLRYTQEWRAFVERSGRWVDFEREYRTMDLDYMESIWWVFKRLWDRGLVYQGLKCVPYSWAINTPLSNFEANLNYKDVQDPAVTVRAEVISDVAQHLGLKLSPTKSRVFAYVWTTTPWTLPSNLALAVGPTLNYSLVANPKDNEIAIVASSLLIKIFPELASAIAENGAKAKDADGRQVLAEVAGEKLVGLEYRPFFDYFEKERAQNAFRIYPGNFVLDTDGTGIVHCASFGEDDVVLFQANNIAVIDPVDEDGRFQAEVTDFAGLNVKEADSKIIAFLKERKALVKHETIVHSYPFCWRTDKPLIYKSISTWFVRVEQIRDELVQMNKIINWVPPHIKEGRFGKWLEGARDWAISRNRYWGTPIPIWKCESCNSLSCLGSVQELEQLTGEKIADLHSHFIDQLTFACTECSGTKRRIAEVLDCWFESGAMPYAQAHYPFKSKEEFEQNFPADFIAEGLDQTRGWFYTLLVLSTALFGRPAFRNVIVNGIVLAEDGKKMSKSLKNYPPPDEVMNEFGADAMRLYLLDSAATRGEDLRFSKAAVRDIVRQTILPLWNAYNFFVTYARVDGWTPAKAPQDRSENLLDQWILSKAASLVEGVDQAIGSYRLYAATQPILEFVDQLTNWYIRLNRRRFWAGNTDEEREDKAHAYTTLHTVLLAFVRTLAPLAPFISEEIFQNLVSDMEGVAKDSVHLLPFPRVEELKGAEVNTRLEQAMEVFEEVILLGRSVRNAEEIKVRQPLPRITVIHPSAEMIADLKPLDSYIREELNIRLVEYTPQEEQYVTLSAQLNTKLLGQVLGPKLGSAGMAELRKKVEALTTADLRSIEQGGTVSLAVDGHEDFQFGFEEILIKRKVRSELKAAASSGRVTIVLDTSISPELRLEGLAREFVNRVQKLRKDNGFEVQDRIVMLYMTACPQLTMALEEHKNYVMRETLTVEMREVRSENEITPKGSSVVIPFAQEIDGKAVVISLMRIQG